MNKEKLAKIIVYGFTLLFTLFIFSLIWFHDGTVLLKYKVENNIPDSKDIQCLDYARNTYCDMKGTKYKVVLATGFLGRTYEQEICESESGSIEKIDIFDDYFYLLDQCMRS